MHTGGGSRYVLFTLSAYRWKPMECSEELNWKTSHLLWLAFSFAKDVKTFDCSHVVTPKYHCLNVLTESDSYSSYGAISLMLWDILEKKRDGI